jgi:hypothetical protein
VSSNAEVSQDQGHECVAEVDTNKGATEEQNLDVEADANDHTLRKVTFYGFQMILSF